MSEHTSIRGKDKTTRQLFNAPQGAIYVWCNEYLGYVRELRDKMNRQDITLVSPSFMIHRQYMGLDVNKIIIDHATKTMAEYNPKLNDELYYLDICKEHYGKVHAILGPCIMMNEAIA